MPGWALIDGIWRPMWTSCPRVDGIMRDSNVGTVIDGVTRYIHKHYFEEQDIVSFRMIYKRSMTNSMIPVITDLTGESPSTCDTTRKGFIFEYSNDLPTEEGDYMYTGTLYAVTSTGEIIDVMRSTETPASDERYDAGIPGLEEVWLTNRIMNLSISMNIEVRYDCFGYYVDGWNSMFSTEQFIDRTRYPDKGPNKDTFAIGSFPIIPIASRPKTFDFVSRIGIRRNMTDPDRNMIGSHGTFDHIIHKIWVDGVRKPFVIEKYD